MTTAFSTFATKIARGDAASPEVFTNIAEVRDISGPSMEAETIDVTSHDSTSGWRDHIPGLKDGGEVTFDVNFDPRVATHDQSTGLASFIGTESNWRVIYPTAIAKQWSFAAVMTKLETKEEVAGASDASITLKINGMPTLEATS